MPAASPGTPNSPDRSARRPDHRTPSSDPPNTAVPRTSQTIYLLAALLGSVVIASGCATDRNQSGLFSPYRVSIPQGTYISQEMLDRVRQGMSRDEVRAALGSPLITDIFHPDRWDYVFRFQYPNGDTERRRVTIEFKDSKVLRIASPDKLPARDDPLDPALPGYQPGLATERPDGAPAQE